MADEVKVAPENVSARDIFMQDDSALAELFGSIPERKDEPKVEAAPKVETKEIVAEEVPTVEVVEAPEAEAADETVEVAEGEEATPVEDQSTPVLQDRPITEFMVTDAHGPLAIPDLTLKFKANGKERELRLDHVVRMAQMGFTNEERENQVAASKKYVAETQAQIQEAQAVIADYDQKVAALLEDPDAYENARIEWERRNSPEARAARSEAEVRQMRHARAEEQEGNLVKGFVNGTLAPFTSKLLEDNPAVTQYELIGRYTELTGPLLVKGRVPVQKLPEVERLVKEDLADWVEARQLERASTKKEAEKVSAIKTKETAEAKRVSARMISTHGKVAPAKQVKTTFTSARDWLDSQFKTE